MKILFVAQMFPSASFPMYGTFVRDKAVALRRIGADVRVCSPVQRIIWPLRLLRRYRRWFPDPAYRDVVPIQRIDWTTFPARLGEALLRRSAHRDILKASRELFHGEQPDIINAHDLFPDGYASIEVARQLGIPLVCTSHGSDNRVHIKHRARRAAVLNAGKYSAAIACVSGAVRRELVAQGIEEHKAHVIHNGIASDRVASRENSERIGRKFANKRVILSVGHMVHFVKGFDITIQAFAKLLSERPESMKDVVLVMVGDGVERAQLEQLARSCGVSDRVYFEGAQPPQITVAYMATCEIFCLPSHYEAFGIVYLEAMLHGKPIIGVSGQGISEVVEHGHTGVLVPPRDVPETAAALFRLLDNRAESLTIGENGRQLVLEKFSEDACARRTLELFEKTLTKDRVP